MHQVFLCLCKRLHCRWVGNGAPSHTGSVWWRGWAWRSFRTLESSWCCRPRGSGVRCEGLRFPEQWQVTALQGAPVAEWPHGLWSLQKTLGRGLICPEILFCWKCQFDASAPPPGNAVETSCWPRWSTVWDATQQPGQKDCSLPGSGTRSALEINTRRLLQACFCTCPLRSAGHHSEASCRHRRSSLQCAQKSRADPCAV